jgi:hypothetical protein
MDFERIQSQRKAKERAIEEIPSKPRNREPVAGSKRREWVQRAWYVRPETATRLRAYVNRQQEKGADTDASAVVDAALSAWLDRVAE